MKNEKIVCIIQARMGSTRLPGKVLMEVGGVPLLDIMLPRVKNSKLIDEVIIATSDKEKDDSIVEFCKSKNYKYFRGSEDDVLLRYFQCAKKYNANVLVRLTADCPLIDPKIIDEVIKLYYEENVDYAANTVPPETNRYPDGSDVEVFSFKGIFELVNKTTDVKDREHVTFPFWKGNHGYKTAQLKNEFNWGKFRITVDYPEDIDVIDYILKNLKKNNEFGSLKEIIDILESSPEIFSKNSKYFQGMNW